MNVKLDKTEKCKNIANPAILEIEVRNTLSNYSKNLKKIFSNNSLKSYQHKLKAQKSINIDSYIPQLGTNQKQTSDKFTSSTYLTDLETHYTEKKTEVNIEHVKVKSFFKRKIVNKFKLKQNQSEAHNPEPGTYNPNYEFIYK
jgi:hypothetical protein